VSVYNHKRQKMRTLKAIAISAVIALAACTERPENETAVNRAPRIFPDYAGVTIPAEIAPMNFNITSSIVSPYTHIMPLTSPCARLIWM